MKTAAQWIPEVRAWVEHVRHDPPSIGWLSKGQQCAVALVLDAENGYDLPGGKPQHDFSLRPDGYSWLDCVDRIEPELLQACIKVQREMQ